MRTLIFCFLPTLCFTEQYLEVISETPKIVIIHEFLSSEECDYLVKIAQPSLRRSTVVNESSGQGAEDIDPRRTSQGVFLMGYRADATVQAIETRLSVLADLPKENGEAIHVLFYEKGAEYQPHFDFFDPETTGGAMHIRRGGQRALTIIMYLNSPAEGGETIFPEAHVAVSPIKGNAVLFYNCLPSGKEDPLTLHGGAPVIRGEKWIATKWFRTGRFQ